jgi:sugar lactone lactonase YvrE
MFGRARLILLVLLTSAAYPQSLFPSGLARFAGKDNSAYTGDNGSAYYSKLRGPAGLARDAAGNLYIAESARIRKIDTRGIITTLAAANNPGGIAVDSRGNLYYSENQSAIRRLAPDGTLTTVVNAAGVAPQGLTQINVRVPVTAVPGSASVKMTLGGAQLNQGSITIWVSE